MNIPPGASASASGWRRHQLRRKIPLPRLLRVRWIGKDEIERPLGREPVEITEDIQHLEDAAREPRLLEVAPDDLRRARSPSRRTPPPSRPGSTPRCPASPRRQTDQAPASPPAPARGSKKSPPSPGPSWAGCRSSAPPGGCRPRCRKLRACACLLRGGHGFNGKRMGPGATETAWRLTPLSTGRRSSAGGSRRRTRIAASSRGGKSHAAARPASNAPGNGRSHR